MSQQTLTLPLSQTQTIILNLAHVPDQTIKDVRQFVAVNGNNAPMDTLSISGRLAEFDTEQKKYEARQNLDLNIIDGGTYN